MGYGSGEASVEKRQDMILSDDLGSGDDGDVVELWDRTAEVEERSSLSEQMGEGEESSFSRNYLNSGILSQASWATQIVFLGNLGL